LHRQAVLGGGGSSLKEKEKKERKIPPQYADLTNTRRLLSKLGFPPCWLLRNLDDEEERFFCMCSD